MKSVPQHIVIYAGIATLIIIIGTVFVGFASPLNKSMQKEKIFVESTKADRTGKTINNYIRISDMEPNSMTWFYYPNTNDVKNRDEYQRFILIRLPVEEGGNKNDSSAFRAYSAIDIDSHCIMKYWPQEGRKRIEDSCHGDMIYPQNGFIAISVNPVNTGIFIGQPYLELSSDSQGYLYVEPPTFEMDKNGVIGIGRTLDVNYVKNIAVQNFEKYTKNLHHELIIPYELTDGSIITPFQGDGYYMYRHPQDARIIHPIQISYCNCTETTYQFGRSIESHSWRLGEETINTDQWFNQEGKNISSQITFHKNGYEILFSGDTVEKTLDLVFDNFYTNKNRSMLELIK